MTYKVLIVDDSKLARMVAVGALGRVRPDWTPVEVGDAQHALRVLEEEAVDVALIDFNMPGINGLDLTAEVRKIRPDMPVALVSANIQQEIVARALAFEAVFLPKPMSDEALANFLSGAALQLRRPAP